ncbi:hypothetical protein HPP92_019757 [Vanilla planifolia]|uniref:Uncharacterized protein n=1 Tax=Vanilla planifolia TaxID=51239 RepID=A0A835UL88_VANPL|nr:hypothetical protein HPP92_019757 [Vanilla planifolia]
MPKRRKIQKTTLPSLKAQVEKLEAENAALSVTITHLRFLLDRRHRPHEKWTHSIYEEESRGSCSPCYSTTKQSKQLLRGEDENSESGCRFPLGFRYCIPDTPVHNPGCHGECPPGFCSCLLPCAAGDFADCCMIFSPGFCHAIV